MLKQRPASKTEVLTPHKQPRSYSMIKTNRRLRDKNHPTKIQIKMALKVGKMAHRVRGLAANPVNLGLISRNCMVLGEQQFLQAVL